MFGDSHAAQWFTAVIAAGEAAGWEVNAWTKTSCPTAEVTIWYPPQRAIYQACDEWRDQRLAALLEDPPALVILGNSSRYYGWIYDPDARQPAGRARAEVLWGEALRRTLDLLLEAGIAVADLRDTPQMYSSYKDCLSVGLNTDCGRSRAEALAGMATEMVDHPLYTRFDLSDLLCSPQQCPAVLDGMVAYRDASHLTASQAKALQSYFYALLEQKSGIEISGR